MEATDGAGRPRESNPLDEPLTDEEREALRSVVICSRGVRRPLTHRDRKSLAQVAMAAHRLIRAQASAGQA